MRVFLVNPPPERVAQRWDQPNFPPLGLGYLAASLKNHGHHVQVLDAKVEGISLSDLLARLRKPKFDAVGLTAMTHEIARAARIARAAKGGNPSLLTMVGGCHVTALPTETLREFPEFDVAFRGEGEESAPEVLSCVERGLGLDHVQGIAYRAAGEVLETPERPWIANLDRLAEPAWELFPRTPVYPILTARGCPFRCVFCMRVLGNRVRFRSPENVLAEIEHVVDTYSPRELVFYDETFTVNRRRTMAILQGMIDRGLHRRVRWVAQTRVNECDAELLALMAEAGCREIDFGIESGNPDVLARIGKGITLDDARRAVTASKRAGIEAVTLFILGHPGETRKTALDTIRFATELNGDHLALGIMVPYPGTEVGRMAANGSDGYRLLSTNWADYDKYLGNGVELENLSRRDLELLQMWGYLRFYVGNRRLGDLLKVVASRRQEVLGAVRHVASRHRHRLLVKRERPLSRRCAGSLVRAVSQFGGTQSIASTNAAGPTETNECVATTSSHQSGSTKPT